MKSANKVLGKKAVGIDALRRRDRDRQGGRNSSSNSSNYSSSSRPNISSPTASSGASTFSEHATSPLSGLRANSSSRPANSPARTSTNMPMASGPITIDLHRFASDNLQPQEIVKQLLGNASEEDIRGFHKSLVEAKQTVGGDLQRNVYRNYTEFVSISKEIASLDGDVMHLKMYLNDVRGIWQGFLTMADQADEATSNEDTEVVLSARKPSDLMSTDLQGVYRSQLTSLWENVEGSQVSRKATEWTYGWAANDPLRT
ncbi:hypothetical protein [Absidia glauca]|uniref:Exocyst complex component EXO84 n=1 Tax=Absidia glauca TaxID=4829 RepID=A0A168Q5G2_ABSGL|nr:hypothetical protein [Absidia glauca]